jgi:hypothetical protein
LSDVELATIWGEIELIQIRFMDQAMAHGTALDQRLAGNFTELRFNPRRIF